MQAIEVYRTLTPLSFSGILRAAWMAFRRSWATLFTIIALGVVAVMAFLFVFLPPILLVIDSDAGAPILLLVGVLSALEIGLLVVSMSMLGAAFIAALGIVHLGGEASLKAALLVGFRRGPTLLLAGVMIALCMLLIFSPILGIVVIAVLLNAASGSDGAWTILILACCLAPFVFAVAAYIGTSLSLIRQTAVFENTNPIEALQRSWELSRGNLLRLFGYNVLVGLMSGGGGGGGGGGRVRFQGGPGDLDQAASWMASHSMLVALLLVFGAIALAILIALACLGQAILTVLYFDLRHRREGFGAAPEAPPSPPPTPGAPDFPPAPAMLEASPWNQPTEPATPPPNPWAPTTPPVPDPAPWSPPTDPEPSPWGPPSDPDPSPWRPPTDPDNAPSAWIPIPVPAPQEPAEPPDTGAPPVQEYRPETPESADLPIPDAAPSEDTDTPLPPPTT